MRFLDDHPTKKHSLGCPAWYLLEDLLSFFMAQFVHCQKSTKYAIKLSLKWLHVSALIKTSKTSILPLKVRLREGHSAFNCCLTFWFTLIQHLPVWQWSPLSKTLVLPKIVPQMEKRTFWMTSLLTLWETFALINSRGCLKAKQVYQRRTSPPWWIHFASCSFS